MGVLFDATEKRTATLKQKGYKVIEIFEHEWRLLRNGVCKDFVKSLQHAAPLAPRDAFFGGRTNATCLYYKPKEGEIIKHLDIISLYPFVNASQRYPVGHPEIFVDSEITQNVHEYFGLVKCSVLPPKNMFHPILPSRIRDKLMFVLCRMCAETGNAVCRHSDGERMLHGTWTTVELQEALRNGYRLIKMDEVWHWKESSEDLFRSYIKHFQKAKQEADGYPEGCVTNEEKARYVRQYFELEGVQLDPAKIAKNPGRRAIAKTCLNSFWGKFGQRSNMGNFKIIRKEVEFFTLLRSQQYVITNLKFDDEWIAISYKERHEFELPLATTNVAIAAFTTGHARLHLWKALHLLGSRALYFDTDSVIYVHAEGLPEPPTGERFGDFKSELAADEHIVEYFSGGPKNYGYRTNKSKEVLKVRGFSLKPQAKTALNYETALALVKEKDVTTAISVPQGFSIARDKNTWGLKSVYKAKDYRVVYDKRHIIPGTYETLPWGYAV